ncbi:MAG: hypothetical protein GXN92_01705 [Candidatus Micrarchaeota archaeon]|nr:hypothetical protein [Candidatus Micrarchaeota archaeon]
MNREKILEGIKKAFEVKKPRNFVQTLEMIINFRNVDFKKNRLNIRFPLPRGKGKENKVIVVADESTLYQIKDLPVDIKLTPEEVPNFPIKELKKIAKKAVVYVQPQYIPLVAKHWGKVLGGRGNTILPFVGDPKTLIERGKNMVRIVTRGKMVPTVHVPIGTEEMSPEALADNAMAVLDELAKKNLTSNIKNIYFKFSMSPPVKVV